MIQNGELRISEIKRVGRKYWWILALTIVGGVLIGLGLTKVLPKRYTSQTVVLVDQPTVSPDIVKPVVTEATNQRLASMQEEILSRSRLSQLSRSLAFIRRSGTQRTWRTLSFVCKAQLP